MANPHAVLLLLNQLYQMPLLQASRIEGVAYTQLLKRLTGLSDARLSQGGFDRLRQSTLKRMKAHSVAAAKASKTPEEFDRLNGRWKTPEMAGAAGWTTFAFLFGDPDALTLPYLTRHAVSLDRKLAELWTLAEADDLPHFKEVGSQYATEYRPLALPQVLQEGWALAAAWGELEYPVKMLLGSWYSDFFAALDAEWGASHFPTMRPVPLFCMVQPCCPALIGRNAISWQEFSRTLRRPVRRLLELLYAMQHRRGRGVWPNEPPGPAELAGACGEEEVSITNYFDGTKHLRMASAGAIWDRLSESFGVSNEGFPAAIAATAICWQHVFTPKNLRQKAQIVVPGATDHELLWERHRAHLPAVSTGGEPWPAWLQSKPQDRQDLRGVPLGGVAASA